MNKPINLQLPLPDLDLIFVEGGTFEMGDNNSKYDWEKPEHLVKVSSFYIGKFQGTQRLWQSVMGNNPSYFKGEKRVLVQVSWVDAQKFIGQLNWLDEIQVFLKKHDMPDAKFRLPTEAEWEFAARGGIYSQGYTYAGSDKLKQVGWYDENRNNETHEVGLLLANELGLYDMSGNVYEWCGDWFDEKFYEKCKKKGLLENPFNSKKGNSRVRRGGHYHADAVDCRSTSRGSALSGASTYSSGFRLCLSLQSVG